MIKIIKPNYNLLRVSELNLFKWTKNGIIMTYGSGFNKRIININDIILKDRDGCLDWLYSLLEKDIPQQQKNDIKEVISEFIK